MMVVYNVFKRDFFLNRIKCGEFKEKFDLQKHKVIKEKTSGLEQIM